MRRITPLKADFVIAGAGVIGLATAWELHRSGASVVVLDRGLAGREASWAGGGMLFPLSAWKYADAVTALTELGRKLYPEWVAELKQATNIDPEYRETGLVVLPPADFERARAWCAKRDLHANLMVGADLSPLLSVHPQALWLPHAAQVRNPRLLRALVTALRARDVPVREHCEIKEIMVAAGRATGVMTAQGPISAGTVIVCAGAWSRALLGQYAEAADIFPVRGQMLLYKTAPGTLPAMLLQRDYYLIPRGDGHILAGSTKEHRGFENTTTAGAAAELHAAASAMLPVLAVVAPVGQWAGLRPGSPANIPIMAAHPRIENLYLNSGHFRYGLTMAPAAALVLANLIIGRPQPLETPAYAWPRVHQSVAADIN